MFEYPTSVATDDSIARVIELVPEAVLAIDLFRQRL